MTKNIVIIDYDMGNTLSVSNALKKLGYDSIVSSKKDDFDKADAYILPGVGAFKEAMSKIHSKNIIESLEENVLIKKKPILGICLGMQIMADRGEEGGETKGLGWFKAEVKKLELDNALVPHVGWNSIDVKKEKPLFKGINSDSHFYFDHSFHYICDEEFVSSYTMYEKRLISSIQKENIFATQFHPEKSQNIGLKLLRNFLNYVEEH